MQEHKIFLQSLSARLLKPLPGSQAHALMEPLTRKKFLHDFQHDSQPKKSAVAIILYFKAQEWHFYLMERNHYPGVHSGQISFPGGSAEKADRSLIDTALREAHEETGIDPNKLNIVGKLTGIYIPPSHFDVLPVVVSHEGIPLPCPDKREVLALFSVSLTELLDPINMTTDSITASDGSKVEVPCFRLSGRMVWGATAMIMSEFRQVITEIGQAG